MRNYALSQHKSTSVVKLRRTGAHESILISNIYILII